MITWLQTATSKHHRTIFGFLLVIVVVAFISSPFLNRTGGRFGGSVMYMGVDLSDPKVQSNYRDFLLFSGLTGQRQESPSLQEHVAQLSLARSLNIPNPSETEIRKIARNLTSPANATNEREGLDKFIDFASKQLNASDEDTRVRFETFIKDAWRINKTLTLLTGNGHASAAQLKRMLDREHTQWTVDAATFSNANFKPTIVEDEAKAKTAFEANKEAYRLPAKMEVTAVTLTNFTPDTAAISDDEIVTYGYNYAEKFKFETGKVKEQALAHRAELEKLIHIDRAVTNLAGLISDELAEKFPLDTTKLGAPAFTAWLNSKNAQLKTIPVFEAGSPPTIDKIPAAALLSAGDLTEKEWHTDVYRTEEGALFVFLNKRTESRLPEFNEVKALALANWKSAERARLMNEEIGRISQALQTETAAGKSFIDSAKKLGLTVSTPAPFTSSNLPDSLMGVHENTLQLLEAAGLGKITAPIRVGNADTVFLRAAKSEVIQEKSSDEQTKLFMQRIAARNAYFTGRGLMLDLTAAPEPEAK
jgi:hypothetical protein